jgi:5-amino-6-(5-phospho-D-ribitylamino)uracil phosphatase
MPTTTSITVAAIDLDDTLLRGDGTLSPRNEQSLHRWQAAGKRLVIATGRPGRSVNRSVAEALHGLPLICYNGAEIHLDGHKIYENLIPAAIARQLVEQVQQTSADYVVGLEIGGELYLNRHVERTSPFHVADLLEVACRPAAKVLIFGDQLERLDPVFAAVPAPARVLHSSRYKFVQILAATADKAEALRVLMEQWQVSLNAVVAFGDDTNDVEMVRECGLGVAMENAVAEVKAVAARITASNDEDGVAQVLEELLRIERRA